MAGDRTAGEVLAGYLHAQASDFLRSLRLHRESGSDVEETVEAARQLRRSVRRIAAALHTYRGVTDTEWADPLRTELTWLSGVLSREHTYAARLERLRSALHRLSGADRADHGPGELLPPAGGAPADARSGSPLGADADGPACGALGPSGSSNPGASTGSNAGASTGANTGASSPSSAGSSTSTEPGATRTATRTGANAGSVGPQRRGGGQAGSADRGGTLTVGAARAGALLERQLTLARTRAHSAALQALGSSRFHAVADAVAVMASEVPLDPDAAGRPAHEVLPPLAGQAHRRLAEAVGLLPLGRAGHPYNAEGLTHGLAATSAVDAPPAAERQDAPWHHVRLLVRLCRYACEVLDQPTALDDPAHAGANAGAHGAATGVPHGGEELFTAVRLFGAAQALERHRDAAEAAAAAAAAARTPRIAPATAYALGVLHADQRQDVEAARFAFGRLWQRWGVSGP